MKLKKILWPGIVAAVALFSACKKDNNSTTTNNSPTVNTQDTTFILQVYQSNNAEIEAGTIALALSSDSAVRNFAQTMINDHTTAQSSLRGLVDSVYHNLTLSDSLNTQQRATRDSLMMYSGRTFDSTYIASQVLAHQQTLGVFDAETAGGQNTQVKDFATRNRPMIQMHLNMADSLSNTFH